MHFGPIHKSKTGLCQLIGFVILLTLAFGCKEKREPSFAFASPNQGQNFNWGEDIQLQLELPKEVKVDEISYVLDGKIIGVTQQNKPIKLATKSLKLGYRMISAVISYEGKKDTINTNIVLGTNQKPIQLTYKVVNTFPHDTSAYTEGLAYIDGRLLESTGNYGASKLKWVALQTGKTLQETALDKQYFGEGSLKLGNKILMLTYKENIGLIYDAKTFKQIGTFPYESSREGWGLAFNGQQILRSDGTNRIWLMNAQTYKEEGFIEVYDNKGPVNNLNELEYIDGKIYANVYLTTTIVRIDPSSGIVEAVIDLAALVPKNYFKKEDEQDNVLNGIAWDAQGKRLFVTGKKWPQLYEIKLNQP